MFVIIGGSGYLGSYLIKYILENSHENIISTYNNSNELKLHNLSNRIKWLKLNIENQNEIKEFCEKTLKNDKHKFIFLSSFHHPDKVEENPKLAWQINAASLDLFLSIAKQNIESLYYASSDSVYGESFNNYIFNENDQYGPLNTYGRTKAIAEQIVLIHGFSVLRYSLLMGPSLISKKHFFDIICESLKNKQSIDMFHDSYRSVISFYQASAYTIKLLENHYKPRDIINISSDIPLSKHDIGVGIAKKFNLDTRYLNPTSINENNSFGSRRAKNTLISNEKLKKILKIKKILYDFK